MKKVSIIVPIFNVERFIEKCIRSLMAQSLDNIEYIFIDDCSPDNSLQVLKDTINDYPERLDDIVIIRHDRNRGLSFSRGEGLEHATGEYVIHCDPDDWVDLDFYKNLYDTAKRHNADLVAADYIIENGDGYIKCYHELFADWESLLYCPKWQFLSLCFHLIRRDFLTDNHIVFYKDVDYAEDNGFMFRCYYFSKKNVLSEGDTFYHYNKTNPNSETTNKHVERRLDHKAHCLGLLTAFVEEHNGDPARCVFLEDEKRVVKEGYLLCSPPNFRKWRAAFPHVTHKVMADMRLSRPYKAAWWLGQYIHPAFMALFFKFSKKINFGYLWREYCFVWLICRAMR